MVAANGELGQIRAVARLFSEGADGLGSAARVVAHVASQRSLDLAETGVAGHAGLGAGGGDLQLLLATNSNVNGALVGETGEFVRVGVGDVALFSAEEGAISLHQERVASSNQRPNEIGRHLDE